MTTTVPAQLAELSVRVAAARRGGTGPRRALVAVAVAYLIAQILLVPAIDLESDEAVYLSQVTGTAPAAPWEAHRARGIALLVLPATALTSSLGAIRGYLLVLSAVALLAAYWPWLRVLPGFAAPLAALGFAGLWPVLFYGSQVSPNLWVAFGAVAAVGWTLRLLHDADSSRRSVRTAAAGVTGSIAFVALMRPSESVWVAAPLLLAVIAAARPAAGRPRAAVLAVVTGLVIGWLPWVVEAFLRFGGPVRRLAEAAELQDSGLANTMPKHLRLLDGGLVCCFGADRSPVVPTGGAVWWAGTAVLALAGVAMAARGRERHAAGTALLVGVTVAGSYLLTSYVATRFLLPTYALLSLPAALALLSLVRRAAAGGATGRARLAAAAVAAVLLAHLGWHGATMALRAGPTAARGGLVVPRAAAELRDLGVRPPCAIVGARAPGIAYHLGCTSGGVGRSRFLNDPAPGRGLQRAGYDVVVVWPDQAPARSYLREWREVPLVRAPGYFAYRDDRPTPS